MLWALPTVAKARFAMLCPKSRGRHCPIVVVPIFLQQNETDGANKQLNNQWFPPTFSHDSGYKKAERVSLSAAISPQNPSE